MPGTSFGAACDSGAEAQRERRRDAASKDEVGGLLRVSRNPDGSRSKPAAVESKPTEAGAKPGEAESKYMSSAN